MNTRPTLLRKLFIPSVFLLFFVVSIAIHQRTPYQSVLAQTDPTPTPTPIPACSPTQSTSIFTVSSSCSFSGATYDGVDYGSGTVNTANLLVSGASTQLTLGNTQSIGVGSVETVSGGSIILPVGSHVYLGQPVWVIPVEVDADLDSHPGSSVGTDPEVGIVQPSGKIRKTDIVPPADWDCKDTGANAADIWKTVSSRSFAKWGSDGTGDGQFHIPRGVAVDSSGNVYVSESVNNRIQKFSSTGTFVTKWGSTGSGDGQFNNPIDVAVDSSGNVYVSEKSNHRIQKFTSTGTFVTKWGSSGSGDGQLYFPRGIAVDASGNVYVADESNQRIQKFTSTGTFVTKWGSLGSGDGQFNNPIDVAVDSSGNVYVADQGNDRVQKFTSTGTFVTKWANAGPGDDYSEAIAVDSSGNVYETDGVYHWIQKFTSTGTLLVTWGSSGSGDGQFSTPYGIAVDANNSVYVVDSMNYRIEKFLTTGASIDSDGDGYTTYGAVPGCINADTPELATRGGSAWDGTGTDPNDVTTYSNADRTANRLRSTSSATVDANDSQYCATEDTPTNYAVSSLYGTTCKQCTNGALVNQAANADQYTQCTDTVTCTGKTYGWSSNACKSAKNSATKGKCTGAGACTADTFVAACTADATIASCGSASCKKSPSCTTGDPTTSWDTIGENCYTSGTGASCTTAGYRCSAVTGTCAQGTWHCPYANSSMCHYIGYGGSGCGGTARPEAVAQDDTYACDTTGTYPCWSCTLTSGTVQRDSAYFYDGPPQCKYAAGCYNSASSAMKYCTNPPAQQCSFYTDN